ncbi:MAG: hypothetical protein R3F65_28250 [bacterium]
MGVAEEAGEGLEVGGGLLGGLEEERGEDGEGVGPSASSGVVVFGGGDLDEVADAPGDADAFAVDPSVAALAGAEDGGEVAGDGGLLGDEEAGHLRSKRRRALAVVAAARAWGSWPA